MLLYITSLTTIVDIRKEKESKGDLIVQQSKSTTKFHSDNLDQVKAQELPLFNFEKLASATNSFHLSNELGKGGFGLVYRVMVALLEVSCLIICMSS